MDKRDFRTLESEHEGRMLKGQEQFREEKHIKKEERKQKGVQRQVGGRKGK